MTEPRQRPEGERAASERSAFERAESELVEFVRSIDVRAPDSLHSHVQALVADASRRKGRPRMGHRRSPALASYAFAGALAAAVAAIAIAIGLSGGGNGPFIRQASALTLDRPTAAAPSHNPHNSNQLAADVQGVAFPYLEDRFGWRATGARSDHVNGRAVTTVFYADRHGRQIGYAIVAGTPAPKQDRGEIAWRRGTRFRMQQLHGATVVSWLRDGHLCVLAGRGVSGATLLALASWQERGTVT
jgi:hypothetical protein